MKQNETPMWIAIAMLIAGFFLAGCASGCWPMDTSEFRFENSSVSVATASNGGLVQQGREQEQAVDREDNRDYDQRRSRVR